MILNAAGRKSGSPEVWKSCGLGVSPVIIRWVKCTTIVSRCLSTTNAPLRKTLRHIAAFTLIEALIAIVLVAVVLPVALSGVSRATETASLMRRKAIALRLADSRLALICADGSWQTSAPSGDFNVPEDGEDSLGFHWQLTTTAGRDPAVHSLKFTVTWDPPADSHSLSLETLATTPTTATGSSTTSPSKATGSGTTP